MSSVNRLSGAGRDAAADFIRRGPEPIDDQVHTFAVPETWEDAVQLYTQDGVVDFNDAVSLFATARDVEEAEKLAGPFQVTSGARRVIDAALRRGEGPLSKEEAEVRRAFAGTNDPDGPGGWDLAVSEFKVAAEIALADGRVSPDEAYALWLGYSLAEPTYQALAYYQDELQAREGVGRPGDLYVAPA
jgi:hypothetical protein